MEGPVRRRLPHKIPQWVKEGSFYFLTINCKPRGLNHLCRYKTGNATLQAAAYYHEHLIWHCRLLLLMPDHLHAVIAFPREPGMEMIVENWKKFLARVHDISFQRGFFDHRLRSEEQTIEKIGYILLNPVRRGLCDGAEYWPWIYRPADRPPPSFG
jgi:putative transposase